MAKKKKEKESSKCPEPFNTLLNLCGMIAMNYIAKKKRKKAGGRKKSGIDPYVATGTAIGLGIVEDTSDLLKLGFALGVVGAFDDDDDEYDAYDNYDQYDWEFDCQDESDYDNHNQYAWRMNCQDGSDYGIYPEDYETRDEYNYDLLLAMGIDDIETEENNYFHTSENNTICENQLGHIYCKVSRLDNGVNDYYLPGNLELEVGDFVIVPTESGQSKAVIICIQSYCGDEIPKPLDETEEILEKC